MNSDKKLIILVGPPGTGKTTQATILAEDLDMIHLESSHVIEEKFKMADDSDERVNKAKKAWLSGGLIESALADEWMLEKIKELGRIDKGVVYTGYPRTVAEVEVSRGLLEDLYGRENIRVINLEISAEEAVKRNSSRRICKASRHPLPNFPEYESLTVCPKDGSEIIIRELDNEETIKRRYQVYLNETKPTLDSFRKAGYTVLEIKGDQPIQKVHQDILDVINGEHVSDPTVHEQLV